ncbi:IS4 family transposase, partial [Cohnella sp. GCM10012308]|uniref:IS4 family transposase n=1 Tax=Cohnella sp. GCM10012308 TaxID=3317329 RepID=UPI003611045F
LRELFSWFDEHARFLLADRYAKKLNSGNTVLLFLEALLRRRPGLEAIAEHLRSSPWMQEWLQLSSIHASSLHRKLESLPSDALQSLVEQAMTELGEAYQDQALAKIGPLAAVDATTISIGAKRGEWAYVQPGQHAVKLHLSLGLVNTQAAHPLHIALSTGVVSDLDVEVLDALVVPSAHTYIFDRGYVSFGRYVDWTKRSIRFVARVRFNNKFTVLRERPCTAGTDRDAEIAVTDPQTGDQVLMRLVEYRYTDRHGKPQRIRVVTNRMELSAQDIAKIYAWRWKIELFFRTLKTQLHLSHIYNSKPEAVWNCIYLNLLIAVIGEIIRKTAVPKQSLGTVIRKLSLYAEHDLFSLRDALCPKRERTSRGRRKRGGRPRKRPKRLKPQRILRT